MHERIITVCVCLCVLVCTTRNKSVELRFKQKYAIVIHTENACVEICLNSTGCKRAFVVTCPNQKHLLCS